MKKVFVISGILIKFLFINAQNDSLLMKVPQQKVFDFFFETGTSVNFFQGMGNMGTYFFSPGLKICVTPKLNLKIKTIINQQLYSDMFLNNETVPNMYNQNKYISLFAEGEYKFTAKLHIKGAIYQGFENEGFLINRSGFYSNYFNNIKDAQSLGIYYQLSKNIQVGAEFRNIHYYGAPLYFY